MVKVGINGFGRIGRLVYRALVEQGLLSASDVRFPWAEGYYYRRLGPQEFILLPPLR